MTTRKRAAKKTGTRPTVLAVHSGALGDCILFSHLLSLLDGEVTLVAGGGTGSLLEGLGAVTKAIDFHCLPVQEIFSDAPLDQCSLSRLLGEYDRLISCFAAGDPRAEQRLAAMCHARTAAFLPIRPPEDYRGHLLDVWGDLLTLGKLSAAAFDPWPVPRTWAAEARKVLGGLGLACDDEYVLIHPGAGSPDKCWPLERFLELAGEFDRAVFTVGPVEMDRWPSDKLAALADARRLLACPSLDVLAGVLDGAKLYIGNDSGVSHLSAAIGKATVALFGPTRPEHFAPLGRSVGIVSSGSGNISDIAMGGVLAAVEDLAS